MIQFGKQYRLINPEEGSNEAAVQFVYEDKVVVTYVRTLSTIEIIETTLKLKGLEEEATYQLQGIRSSLFRSRAHVRGPHSDSPTR